MNKLFDLLSKHQKYFLGGAIFLSLLAVSITIHEGQIQLNLQSYPIVMLLLVIISLLLAFIYIGIDKNKIKKLSNQIRETPREKTENLAALLLTLTARQKEVYDLILAEKSNKEIMAELFIEQSTLKSHINQIYKKLDIKNRKELKQTLRQP